MQDFKITTLVENTTISGIAQLVGEHGLSFFIETDNKKILFDTGQGIAISNNVKTLGIDLNQIESVVLSHGHFDHGGGLKNVIDINSNFTLHAHPDVFDEKLLGFGDDYYDIGIRKYKEIVEKSNVNICFEKNSVEIAPGIITTGEIPLVTDFEKVEDMFVTEKNGNKIPDKIIDDKALILDTKKGIVVVFGCAHRGPINTLKHVTKLTGSKKIYAIMGGLHLILADENKLSKIADYFNEFEIQKMIIGHCTGFHAIVSLYNRFGNKLVQNTVGHVFGI